MKPANAAVIPFPKAVRRDRDELAFLPAALEIVETPPSPTGRAIGVTIIALFCLAVGLAITTYLAAEPTTAPATRPTTEPDAMAADWPKMRPIAPRGYVCYRAESPVTKAGEASTSRQKAGRPSKAA